MTALLILAISLAAPETRLGDSQPSCVVAEGRVVAEVRVGGVVVRARPGALEVDGLTITPCEGLPGAYPTALAVADDTLYVGFRAAGLHRYLDGRFEPVAGLAGRAIRALASHGGGVWVGTDRGLLHAQGAQARRIRHWVIGRREVTALHVAADHTLHIGAGPYGWWHATHWYDDRNLKPKWSKKPRIERIERQAFVGCFSEVAGKVEPRTTASSFGITPGSSFGVTPGFGCGLGMAAAASGLPSGHVTTLASHRGVLYVGTFDAGLARQVGDRFEPVPGAPRFVNALLSDGRALHIGTPRGLFRLQDGVVRRAPVALPSHHVNGLARADDGTRWVATSAGIVGIGPRGVRVIDRAAGLPGRIVYSVTTTRDGAVWAGTAGGVARITSDGVTTYTHAGGQLPHDWVNALLPDGDGVLAGTYDAGVWRLAADGSGEPVAGLQSAWVNPAGLARMGGTLLVTTLGGGLLVRRGGEVVRQARLPSEDVTAVVRHRGQLWIGTRGGLAQL